MHALEFSTTDKIDENSQFIEFKPFLSVIDFFPYHFYNFIAKIIEKKKTKALRDLNDI